MLTQAPRRLRFAVGLLLACAPVRAAAQVSAPGPGAAPPAPARISFTITDEYGRFVTGLGRNAFTLLVDDREQEIAEFSDDEEPVSFALVLALSGPADAPLLKALGTAFRLFIETSMVSDEFFLIAEGSRLPGGRPPSVWGKEAADGVQTVAADSGAGLFDLCALGVETLNRKGRHEKRALLLVGDSAGTQSRIPFAELRARLGRSNVILNSIYFPGRQGDGSDLEDRLALDLDELTTVTGGKAFFPAGDNSQLNDLFERLALQLRTLYTVGFKPPPGDGGWHKVKVRVTTPPKFPTVFIRSRELFYDAARGPVPAGAPARPPR